MPKYLNIRAILVGLIVSWAVSLSGECVSVTVLATHTGLGSKVNGHYETSSQLLHLAESIPLRLIGIAILGVGSIIGGATTGWLVSDHRLKNAMALALVHIAMSAPFIPFMKNYPIWLALISMVAILTFTVLGGWISQFIFRNSDKSE